MFQKYQTIVSWWKDVCYNGCTEYDNIHQNGTPVFEQSTWGEAEQT